MTDRDRFAVEVILVSWAALAVSLVVILALGTALEQARDEVDRTRADVRCVCEEVRP